MDWLDTLINLLPEVRPSKKKKLGFKAKLRWTAVVLLSYLLMTHIPLWGLGQNALQQFSFLSTILGASFGSLMSLGIGPIVTSSIVLQLLNGSGIIPFDTNTKKGKQRFQGTQKILAILFTFVEAIVFVFMGGLAPAQGVNPLVIIIQLFIGGMFIIYMDEIISKYGFGSGVSLFIAAGVSQQIFIQLLSPLSGPDGVPAGIVPFIFQQFVGSDVAALNEITINILIIIATILVFGISIYVTAMKIEIPLSFGRVKGHGVRWPLKFMYSNVIPIIFVSALLANIQLVGRFLENAGNPILGTFANGQPQSGVATYLTAPTMVEGAVTGLIDLSMVLQGLSYLTIYIVGSAIFSVFWVQSSGLDAKSQAQKMVNSGLQVPGFRRDIRVLERLLQRYIGPLSIISGIAIGLIASVADLTQAVGTGTGILLTVMIIYRLYEEIAEQHVYDMNPALRQFMGEK